MKPRKDALQKKNLKMRLKVMPPQLCLSFSSRIVLRVLPLLAGGKHQPFWYWQPQEREKHLLSVLRGLLVGMVASTNIKKGDYYSEHAAIDAVMGSSTSIYTRVALYASKIANPIPNLCCNSAIYIAWDTIAYVFYAANEAMLTVYEDAIMEDFNLIVSYYRHGCLPEDAIDPLEFLQRPLWPKNRLPSLLQPQWCDFHDWVKSLDSGCEISLDWYLDRIKGKVLHVENLNEQLEKINVNPWREGIKSLMLG